MSPRAPRAGGVLGDHPLDEVVVQALTAQRAFWPGGEPDTGARP